MSKIVQTYVQCPCCLANIVFKTIKPLRLSTAVKWVKCKEVEATEAEPAKGCGSQYFLEIKIKNQGGLLMDSIEEKLTKKGLQIKEERDKQTAPKGAQQKEVENAKRI